MTAYYNENDPFAVAWLRNLINGGHIAPGHVDERSILDVQPADLKGYRQIHLFAGIGGWSLALRLAGVPDDEPIWTGSAPCQPLSCAGKRAGHADERHLWPALYRLITERRPAVCFGEQVASVDGREWLAGVRADLEGAGYAVGAANLPACGIGAPHIRARVFWMAHARHEQAGRPDDAGRAEGARSQHKSGGRGAGVSRVANASGDGRPTGRSGDHGGDVGHQPAPGGERPELAHADCAERWADPKQPHRQEGAGGAAGGGGGHDGLAHANGGGRAPRHEREQAARHRHPTLSGGGGQRGMGDAGGQGLPLPEQQEPGGSRRKGRGRAAPQSGGAPPPRVEHATGERRSEGEPGSEIRGGWGAAGGAGAWDDGQWITGADGKTRRVGAGVRPLAHGIPNRVGMLRGYGNAIVPPLAAQFILAGLAVVRELSPSCPHPSSS